MENGRRSESYESSVNSRAKYVVCRFAYVLTSMLFYLRLEICICFSNRTTVNSLCGLRNWNLMPHFAKSWLLQGR